MLADFPPFSINEDNQLKGFSYDVLQLISKKSGLKFKYSINNWPQNIKDFKEKKVDMIDAISYKESRLTFTNFTKPYHESPLIIFSRKEFSTYNGLDSLKNKKLGITKNIFYKKDIEDLNMFNIVEYDSFQEKLKALAFGEIDIIFGHLHSTQNSIEKKGYTNIQALDELNLKNVKKTDLRFGIVKENTLLHSIITKSYNDISDLEWNKLSIKWLSVHSNKSKDKVPKFVNLSLDEKDFLLNKNISCQVTDSWAPIHMEINNELNGIAIDYWKLITQSAHLNIPCKKANSFDEVLKNIKNKTTDITISTTITKDRLQYANFSKSYISYPIAIATRDTENFISNTSYLENKKVAIGKGYSAYEILKSNYPKIHFIQVENTQVALQMVLRKRAYAAIDILPVLANNIGQKGYENLKISGTTEFDFDMRVMIRDDYKELVSIINKGIDLISDKERNSIGKKWASIDYKHGINYYDVVLYILIILLIIGFYLLYKHVLLKQYNQQLELIIKEKVQLNREKDKQMFQQSRLAQMGELISMIAHQWRQPLSSIASTTINMQTHIELNKFDISKEKGKEDFIKFMYGEFDKIELFTQTLSETMEDFINFYRPNKTAQFLSSREAIQTALKIADYSLKNNNITIIEEYSSVLEVNIYKNELIQVLLNLFKNTQDNFNENHIKNQTIWIITRDLDNGITIEIKDNGTGIEESMIDKIFDPYFSTKAEKQGTGLGLYMSKLIIEEHHKGKLYIHNHNLGVSFIIFLPK